MVDLLLPESPRAYTLVLNAIAAALNLEVCLVDIERSFLHHGGNSLTALNLASDLIERGIRLPIANILTNICVRDLINKATWVGNPCYPVTASNEVKSFYRRDCSAANQDAWEIHEGSGNDAEDRPSKRVKHDDDRPHLTEFQQTLITSSISRPGTNVIQFFDTYHSKHLPRLKEAWKLLLELENFQRWNFCSGKTASLELKDARPVFQWDEVLFNTETSYLDALERPYDGPPIDSLFKVFTLCERNKPQVSTIIWHVHHALIDGFSASTLYRKLYRLLNGKKITAGVGFGQIAEAVNSLHAIHGASSRTFWAKQQIKHPNAASEIPFPSSEPWKSHHKPLDTHSLTIELSKERLWLIAKHLGVALVSLHYAIWSLVLAKFADSDTIVFGALVSGRSLAIEGLLDAVGPTINLLPFHASPRSSSSIAEFLNSIQAALAKLDSISYSSPNDGFSRQCSSAIAMEPSFQVPETSSIRPLRPASFKCVNDVPINILVNSDGGARLVYRTDRLQERHAKLLMYYYARTAQLLVSGQYTIKSIFNNMESEMVQQEILTLGNAYSSATLDSSVSDDLVTVFEISAKRFPHSIALQSGNTTLTYQELDFKASQVAHQVKELVLPGQIVAIHADRSINFIVAIYAVLKAGAVYAPFDPRLPAKTRNSYYQTARASLFLFPNKESRAALPVFCEQSLCIKSILRDPDEAKTLPHRLTPRPGDNAYVCFTSGSTGLPKAVLCHHRGLVAFQKDKTVRLHAEPGVKVTQLMSPAFDGSIHEIFSTLSYGATLLLPVYEGTNFEILKSANSAILTPSLARLICPDDYPNLEYVYLVGEAVPQAVNDAWTLAKKVYNMYGPTEATCGATIKQLKYGEPVTIGRPNPSTRVYVLDRNRSHRPPGCEGDIYLAGIQVSNGYMNLPEANAERFFMDPLAGDGLQRMYKTGDRGFWGISGDLHYVGRQDRQVKLKGFRIDLDTLEISIAKILPEVAEVAVISRNQSLEVFLRPSSLDCQGLKSKLSDSLAPYAMPRDILLLDSFPTTAAGKLDYKALLEIASSRRPVQLGVSLNMVETEVAGIWREILDLDGNFKLEPSLHFATLGGDSLLQMSLSNRLSQAFGLPLQVKHIIQNPKFGELVRCLKDLLQTQASVPSAPNLCNVSQGEHLSSIEREWCQKYQSARGKTAAFNVSVAYSLDVANINTNKLERAWNKVLCRHNVLRSRYMAESHGFRRKLHETPPQVQRMAEIDTRYEVNKPFDLRSDHLFRVLLSPKTMLICASHILCDLTTMSILLKEMIAAYQEIDLEPSPRSYTEFCTVPSEPTTDELAFWKKMLASVPKPISREKKRQSFMGTSHLFELGQSLSRSFLSYVASHSYTAHQLALATIGLVSCIGTDHCGIIIGSPYINRSARDMSTVGLFLEALPIAIPHLSKSPTDLLELLVDYISTCSQASLAHALPLSQIIRHLGLKSDSFEKPLFEVMVTFHDERIATSSGDGGLPMLPGMERRLVWSEGAKFKLMYEFTALEDDCIVLRIEYDSDIYSREDIARLESLVLAAVELVAHNATFGKAREVLKALHEGKAERKPANKIEFGRLFQVSPIKDAPELGLRAP